MEALIVIIAVAILISIAKPWTWSDKEALHDILKVIQSSYGGEVKKNALKVKALRHRGNAGEFSMELRMLEHQLDVQWTCQLASPALDGFWFNTHENTIRWQSGYILTLDLDRFLYFLFAGDRQKIARHNLDRGTSQVLRDFGIQKGKISICWSLERSDATLAQAASCITSTHDADMNLLADIIDVLATPKKTFWRERAEIFSDEDPLSVHVMITLAILSEADEEMVETVLGALLHERDAALAILTLPAEYLLDHADSIEDARLLSLCRACSEVKQQNMSRSAFGSVQAELYVALLEVGEARFSPTLLARAPAPGLDEIGAGMLLTHVWNRSEDTSEVLTETLREIFPNLDNNQRAIFLGELARYARASNVELLVSTALENAPFELLDAWMRLLEKITYWDNLAVDREVLWEKLTALLCDSPHEDIAERAESLISRLGTTLAMKVLSANVERDPRVSPLLEALHVRHAEHGIKGGLTLSEDHVAGGLTLSKDATQGALSITPDDSEA